MFHSPITIEISDAVMIVTSKKDIDKYRICNNVEFKQLGVKGGFLTELSIVLNKPAKFLSIKIKVYSSPMKFLAAPHFQDVTIYNSPTQPASYPSIAWALIFLLFIFTLSSMSFAVLLARGPCLCCRRKPKKIRKRAKTRSKRSRSSRTQAAEKG